MRSRNRAASATLVLLAALVPAEARGAASPWSEHEVVAARLVAVPPSDGGELPESGELPEGEELRLGLHVRLADGWHVYWRHAGDAGLPPEVVLASEVSLGPPRLLFPAPHRYRLRGGLVANGYGGEVVYPVRVRADGAARPRRISASVDYLACEDECIPFHDDLELALDGGDAGEAELLARWEARLPVALARVPGAGARAEYLGTSAGGELALTLEGMHARDVFVAPMPGVVVGIPRWEDEASRARALVELRPESAGRMPATLPVSFVVTGVAGAGAGEAVEGSLETAGAASAGAAAPDAAASVAPDGGRRLAAAAPGGEESSHNPLLTLLSGAALALTPGSLAVLAMLALAPRSGHLWRVPALAAAGAALALGAAGLLGRLAGNAALLVEPPALAALAIPQLILALAFWWGAGSRLASLAAGWGSAAIALLALPFVPLLGRANPTTDPLTLALLAAGFAVPVLAALSLPRPQVAAGQPDAHELDWAAGVALLGFLPAASLAWISYRLLLALPSVRLAGIQLAWLGAALAVFLGAAARPAGRAAWWTLGAATLASSVWLAR